MFTSMDDANTKVTDSSSLRSSTIDRARLIEINRQQWAAIKLAKVRLNMALAAQPNMFKVHCMAALWALRGIGEE